MRFFISVTLCIAYEFFAQECKKDEHAIFGMMLRRHTFKKLKSSIAVECNRACNDDFRCHSFNYLITEKLCELNNRTKEARPENFVPNSERYYVRSNKKRGEFKALLLAINYESLFIDKCTLSYLQQILPLGSILEFPAETCEEINASEDGKAKSGEYWIYSVITGKTALVSCDMEPEDIDECASGVHNCHSSASCTNTVGSFKCSCNKPYIGDGKSCIPLPSGTNGNEECLNVRQYNEYWLKIRFNLKELANHSRTSQSAHAKSTIHWVAHSLGVGRLVCSFAFSFQLDDGENHQQSYILYKSNTKGFTWFVSILGPTSIISTLSILECQNYQSLTGSDRKITYGNQNTVCDRGIHGWYRFEGAAGTRMPTSCPPKQRCNTHASGWLNGAHPTVADGQVTRTVCFHWGSNCCNWSRSVNVINCGDYYVYYITGTPACSLRYCSTD
ncbi:unnamed protein product [Pocillopora meandrina]|uniref:Uromodulin n=1 Tax=Pocillopora meandrina TaxID=46732 RepID=A0AAU9Y4S7_9CNID|nr:unnamed protein product [Pocillopora meandrina]